LDDLGDGREVVVSEKVAHASDIAPRDVRLGRRQLGSDCLDRFADLQESHGNGVHDDLN
jgi:hypothetical protein